MEPDNQPWWITDGQIPDVFIASFAQVFRMSLHAEIVQIPLGTRIRLGQKNLHKGIQTVIRS